MAGQTELESQFSLCHRPFTNFENYLHSSAVSQSQQKPFERTAVTKAENVPKMLHSVCRRLSVDCHSFQLLISFARVLRILLNQKCAMIKPKIVCERIRLRGSVTPAITTGPSTSFIHSLVYVYKSDIMQLHVCFHFKKQNPNEMRNFCRSPGEMKWKEEEDDTRAVVVKCGRRKRKRRRRKNTRRRNIRS